MATFGLSVLENKFSGSKCLSEVTGEWHIVFVAFASSHLEFGTDSSQTSQGLSLLIWKMGLKSCAMNL